MSGHWPLYKGKEKTWICAYQSSGDCYSTIALVEFGEERPVRQMLRYARLGEQVESIVDGLLSEHIDDEKASKLLLQVVRDCVSDIMNRGKVSCPEIDEL